MCKWPAQVGTVVANVGRELSLLKMAINKANADYLLFFLWNELEPRFQQRAAGSLGPPGPENAKRLTSIQVSTTAIWRPTFRERITVPTNRMNSVRNQFQPRKGVI